MIETRLQNVIMFQLIFLSWYQSNMTENLTFDILNMSVPVSPTDKSGLSFCYNYISSQSVGARHLCTRRTQVCLFDSSEWPRRAVAGWETPSPSPPPSRRSPHPLNHQPSLIMTAGLLRDYSGTSSSSSLGIQMITICIYLSSQHNMTRLWISRFTFSYFQIMPITER